MTTVVEAAPATEEKKSGARAARSESLARMGES
jgi:hypothetical protein